MIQEGEAAMLAERIAAFKSDPERLQQATEFVEQIIKQAAKEAELKQKEKERKCVSINVCYGTETECKDVIGR